MTDNVVAAARGSDEHAVYAAIYDAVMDHRLPPGTKLTEAAFSEYFGVSRTIIRKALFRLAQQNVVEQRPNRGAIVACPTPAETHQVFEARRVLEREIIRLVSGSATKKQLKGLRAVIKQEHALQDAGDRRGLIRLSGQFHLRLAELAGNDVLTQFIHTLVSRTSLIIALYDAPGVPACSTHDHDELINFMQEQDVEAAVAAMGEHLDEIESRLRLETTEGALDLADVFDAG